MPIPPRDGPTPIAIPVPLVAPIRYLDAADRIAPTRIRNDPIARDLVLTLDRQARCRAWKLDSLRNRLGISAQG